MSRRINVEIENMPFGVLHGLLAKGEAYLAELAAAKLAAMNEPTARKKRNIKGETLRDRHPW